MTAEIAILNKSAVALSADSAVTISAGSKEEKIFDTAEKLFELSDINSIGVMIYNGMSFAGIPLHTIIRQFRSDVGNFDTVQEAGESFLKYLNQLSRNAPKNIAENVIFRLIRPLFGQLQSDVQRRINESIDDLVKQNKKADQIHNIFKKSVDDAIDVFASALNAEVDAEFYGGSGLKFDAHLLDLLKTQIENSFNGFFIGNDHKPKIVELAKLALRKGFLSDGYTGIVIAGFGDKEIFPTLVSFEIDGFVCGRLKFMRRNMVDIDRAGVTAKVIPFAQKEMVERFLYGLDEEIQNKCSGFL